MALIEVKDLSFTYEGSFDPVFENASFRIDTCWKLGFTGRNGRGKTTFLKLLMGEYPYRGRISSPVEFDYFPFDVEDGGQSALRTAQSVAAFERWRLEKELSLMGFDLMALERPYATLSGGERTKLLLAALFLREGRFLLIDEPTNHLDLAARAAVSRYLNGKAGFILVSHDREFLDGCVDHILSINRADIEVRKGGFSAWLEDKRRRDDLERAENERLRGEIDNLARAARRTADWSDRVEKSKRNPLSSGLSADTGYIGHKAAKMMKRSKAIEKRREAAAEEKSALLKNVETADELKIHPLRHHADRLVELADAAIFYGGAQACRGVTLEVRRGERVALTGRNGCGKSSVLRLILEAAGQGERCGAEGACGVRLAEGRISVASGLIISHVPQDAAWLSGDMRGFCRGRGIDESLFKAILRKLDLPREQFGKDLGALSGGQKKKALLAASLCEEAHLYVWDEPLNYIDVLSRVQLEELLPRHNPAMLFVEHDRAFVGAVATRMVELE